MPKGPGKYDAACERALIDTGAKCAILIVLGGRHGNGFSINATDPKMVAGLPERLREIARQIEPDVAADVADPGEPRAASGTDAGVGAPWFGDGEGD